MPPEYSGSKIAPTALVRRIWPRPSTRGFNIGICSYHVKGNFSTIQIFPSPCRWLRNRIQPMYCPGQVEERRSAHPVAGIMAVPTTMMSVAPAARAKEAVHEVEAMTRKAGTWTVSCRPPSYAVEPRLEQREQRQAYLHAGSGIIIIAFMTEALAQALAALKSSVKRERLAGTFECRSLLAIVPPGKIPPPACPWTRASRPGRCTLKRRLPVLSMVPGLRPI